ncbi:hypothetical protein KIL84_004452 [Mauremys mutica]|uniref:Ig-like domain-containing protein n=1 Tax=Mauremys mutica TaxID=74926 RepID=A0A9D3XPQ9_9SAUR|nr:hypothetical protein KIL84_004452 [Mauremys mutica]
MVCRSGGWYPEPQSLWKDLKGQPLPSLPAKYFRDENGLFQTESVLIVTENSNQNLTCTIRNNILNQEEVSSVYIADKQRFQVEKEKVLRDAALAEVVPTVYTRRLCEIVSADGTFWSPCSAVPEAMAARSLASVISAFCSKSEVILLIMEGPCLTCYQLLSSTGAEGAEKGRSRRRNRGKIRK